MLFMLTPTWQSDCGLATLWLADCREVISTIVKGAVDAVLTDPPYGLDKGRGTINRRGKASLVTWADTLGDVQKIYIPAFIKSLNLAGGRGCVTPGTPNCFKYPTPADMGGMYQPASVSCSRWGRATFQPVLFYGKDPRAGKHLDPTAIAWNQPAKKNGHPCPKPLGVARWLVSRVSLENEVVFDPFMGSGTTGVACIELGRKFWGIEVEPKYFEIAKRRIIEALTRDDFLTGKINKPDPQIRLIED